MITRFLKALLKTLQNVCLANKTIICPLPSYFVLTFPSAFLLLSWFFNTWSRSFCLVSPFCAGQPVIKVTDCRSECFALSCSHWGAGDNACDRGGRKERRSPRRPQLLPRLLASRSRLNLEQQSRQGGAVQTQSRQSHVRGVSQVRLVWGCGEWMCQLASVFVNGYFACSHWIWQFILWRILNMFSHVTEPQTFLPLTMVLNVHVFSLWLPWMCMHWEMTRAVANKPPRAGVKTLKCFFNYPEHKIINSHCQF